MPELAAALARNGAHSGRRIAMRDDHTSINWADLAQRVGGAAEDLGFGDETIGITGDNSIEWAIAFLAAHIAGKTIVPVPAFFSADQCTLLARDAGIERIIHAGDRQTGRGFIPVPVLRLSNRHADLKPGGGNSTLLIYTSGSTGQPKGVRLAQGQAIWTATALANAVNASPTDKYLSLLPLAMLLEIICAIIIPVMLGAQVVFNTEIAAGVAMGCAGNLAAAFEHTQPTMSVLVPQLLALYAGQLAAMGNRPPDCLRSVAVGGAPLPPCVAKAAEQAGIAYFEGYGLSECASVVAVNRPGTARKNSVGMPLPGLDVTIDDGEIIVTGPSVMDGYLHGKQAPRRWRTGDLGELDKDGFLRIFGRRDNLIVTPTGRNISPEWIETLIMGDPALSTCVLALADGQMRPDLILIPSATGTWLDSAGSADLRNFVMQACETAPAYTYPGNIFVVSSTQAMQRGLLTSTGSIQRPAAAKYINEIAMTTLGEKHETL